MTEKRYNYPYEKYPNSLLNLFGFSIVSQKTKNVKIFPSKNEAFTAFSLISIKSRKYDIVHHLF